MTKRSASGQGRWRQWKPEEARRELKAWRESGLPLATFARQRGVGNQRLRWWRERLGDEAVPAAADAALPIRLVPAVIRPSLVRVGGAAITAQFPGGVAVEISDPTLVPADWFATFIRAVTAR